MNLLSYMVLNFLTLSDVGLRLTFVFEPYRNKKHELS